MRVRGALVVGAMMGWAAVAGALGSEPDEKAVEVSDPWEIPPAASERKNPLPPTEEALRIGRALWSIHCETCHGSEGRGDGPNARLHERRKHHAPRNLTKPNVQENLTDGDILWRVTHGIIEGDNVIMPAYGDKVKAETERWLLVLYVRELGRRATGP